MTPDTSDTPEHTGEFLSFQAGGQDYAVDIMSVREIRGWTSVTDLPRSPDYMRGVMNLRGTVLPILDLAGRLGLDAPQPSERNVIIVVRHEGDTVGLLVDAVSDILTVGEADMQPAPELAAEPGQAFITALIVQGERLIRLLDLSATLSGESGAAA